MQEQDDMPLASAPGPAPESDASVLELLDRLLNTGVVLVGDLAINVADIELVYLRLQVMLSSAETARQAGWLSTATALQGAQKGCAR